MNPRRARRSKHVGASCKQRTRGCARRSSLLACGRSVPTRSAAALNFATAGDSFILGRCLTAGPGTSHCRRSNRDATRAQQIRRRSQRWCGPNQRAMISGLCPGATRRRRRSILFRFASVPSPSASRLSRMPATRPASGSRRNGDSRQPCRRRAALRAIARGNGVTQGA